MTFIIYFLAAVLTFFVVIFCASKFMEIDPENADDFMPAIIGSLVCALIWPVALPAVVLGFSGYAIIKKLYKG
jgi:hypothetical protein